MTPPRGSRQRRPRPRIERGLATPEDTSIGPARPLSIDGILGPEPFDHSRWAGLVPHLEGALDDGGIRLRHRLLPQSHGFEGFGTVPVAAMASDFPVTQCEDVEGREPHLYAATSAAADLQATYNDVISVVEHFLWLKSERIPCREPLSKPRLDLVAATVDLLADGDPGRNLPLDFRAERLKRPVIIGTVKRAEQRTHELDVLQRHRHRPVSPSSPPQGEHPHRKLVSCSQRPRTTACKRPPAVSARPGTAP